MKEWNKEPNKFIAPTVYALCLSITMWCLAWQKRLSFTLSNIIQQTLPEEWSRKIAIWFSFINLLYQRYLLLLVKVYLLLLVEATPKCAVLMVVSTQFFSLFCSGWVDSPWHIQKYFIFQHKLLSDQLIITSLLCCSETLFMSYYNIILSNSILKCSFIIFDSLENSILK